MNTKVKVVADHEENKHCSTISFLLRFIYFYFFFFRKNSLEQCVARRREAGADRQLSTIILTFIKYISVCLFEMRLNSYVHYLFFCIFFIIKLFFFLIFVDQLLLPCENCLLSQHSNTCVVY